MKPAIIVSIFSLSLALGAHHKMHPAMRRMLHGKYHVAGERKFFVLEESDMEKDCKLAYDENDGKDMKMMTGMPWRDACKMVNFLL